MLLWRPYPGRNEGEMTKETNVLIIGTGGTISCLAADRFDFLDYPVAGTRLSPRELLDTLSITPSDITLRTSGFEPVSSTELGPEFWWSLRAEISAAIEANQNLSGIVVTHGTATLEESAFALDVLLGTDVPIVFTGSQRPANAISSDAAHNLWGALRVASSPKARGRGVLVVMNGEIHAAADVTKSSNFALDAFESPNSGPLGTIEGTSVSFRTHPQLRSPSLAWRRPKDWPRVDVVASYAGADGTHIDASVAAGAKGIVVAGLAPGYATPDQRRALREAHMQGVVAVMSSRASAGSTVCLRQNGLAELIGARRLSPQKARILLSIALMQTADIEEIDNLFAQFS
ncbi:asparaginase [uncultured Roseobacter sp.]|uniref:asparaginase n=2 Tax=uncultured Roseobacter sp. TaxID=114847 RepID=UPI002620E5D7|nr:asparaginase [uncultured Roseobacter sp.]